MERANKAEIKTTFDSTSTIDSLYMLGRSEHSYVYQHSYVIVGCHEEDLSRGQYPAAESNASNASLMLTGAGAGIGRLVSSRRDTYVGREPVLVITGGSTQTSQGQGPTTASGGAGDAGMK
jgi:hypothetical protein